MEEGAVLQNITKEKKAATITPPPHSSYSSKSVRKKTSEGSFPYLSFLIILRFNSEDPLGAGSWEFSLQVINDRINSQRLPRIYFAVYLRESDNSDEIVAIIPLCVSETLTPDSSPIMSAKEKAGTMERLSAELQKSRALVIPSEALA